MEMKFSKELVDKFAKDLLFELTPLENKSVLDEFEVIKENMDSILKIDGLDKVDPMTHPLEYDDVILRSDEVGEELKS